MSKNEKNRKQVFEKVLQQHRAAIQSALSARQRARQSIGEVVTLRSGVQLVISYGSQGYQIEKVYTGPQNALTRERAS